MPSVRVRRGSLPYTTLESDSDERQGTAERQNGRRPRSGTLASIFRQDAQPSASPPAPPHPSPPMPSPDSPQAHSRHLSPSPRQSSPSSPQQRYGSLRSKPSKIADSILSGRMSQRRLLPRGGSTGRSSVETDRDRRESLTLEGAQADVVIPTDGHPGLIGSSLSLGSSIPGSWDTSSRDEFHHEDEIVEHLDVIGMHQHIAPSRLHIDIWHPPRPPGRYNIEFGQCREFHPDVGFVRSTSFTMI